MARSTTYFLLISLVAAASCQSLRNDAISRQVSRTIEQSDRAIGESQTLASIAKMELSLSEFTRFERRIPAKLSDLIPAYLAEIPPVRTGVRRHKDTSGVKAYPAEILRGGQIDGTQLRDTGKWGYVYNDRLVVVFVDCTHPTTRGRPWYQERPD